MKIVIDMNLSPSWSLFFGRNGWDTRHWEEVGDPCAPDSEIMEWARQNGYIVFTHDLDFGALLASTGAVAPSVIQLRSEDSRPDTMGSLLLAALESHRGALDAGALVRVDPRKMRVTLLPLPGSE